MPAAWHASRLNLAEEAAVSATQIRAVSKELGVLLA